MTIYDRWPPTLKHCRSIFRGSKSGQSFSRQQTTRPEAVSMDYVVRPQSKVDPEEIRARAKQLAQNQRRTKVGYSFPSRNSSDMKVIPKE